MIRVGSAVQQERMPFRWKFGDKTAETGGTSGLWATYLRVRAAEREVEAPLRGDSDE
jgi:hypothetical protein